jgi:hypothetical protein
MRTASVSTIGTLAVLAVCVAPAAAQFDLPFKGNPTPGTEQPKQPDPATRIRLTGCVKQVIPEIAPADANTPSDAHFLLIAAKRDTQGPRAAKTAVKAAPLSETFRLFGIDSVIAPLAGSRVEITGDVVPLTGEAAGAQAPPILRVLVVRRLAESCS